jgi:hypothetical protein
VNSPWTDDELLQELAAALAEEPVDEHVIQAAEAAFSWMSVDADLLSLTLDSDREPAGSAHVRDSGPDRQRTLMFRGEQLTVDIEIDEAGIAGQLTPPQPGHVALVGPNQPGVTVRADEVGCFFFPSPVSGPVRLDCRIEDGHFVTPWITT